ncbi:hypothetical protein D3C85_1458010 [compost metagenome]
MDVDAVNGRHELRPCVELRLGLAPVVVRGPVAHQRLHLCQLRALGGVADGFLVGPAGGRDALAQVEQILLRHRDLEGADAVVGGRCICRDGYVKQEAEDDRKHELHLHDLC